MELSTSKSNTSCNTSTLKQIVPMNTHAFTLDMPSSSTSADKPEISGNEINLKNDIPTASIQSSNLTETINGKAQISGSKVMIPENSLLSNAECNPPVTSKKITSDSHGKMEKISTSVDPLNLMSDESLLTNMTADPLLGCFEVSTKSDKKVSKIILRPTLNSSSKVLDSQKLQSLGIILCDPESSKMTQPNKVQPNKLEVLKNVRLGPGKITTHAPVSIQQTTKSLLKPIVDSVATVSSDKTTLITASSQPHTTPAILQESSGNTVKNSIPTNSALAHHGRLFVHYSASNKINTPSSAVTTKTTQTMPEKTANIHSLINKIIKYSKTSSSSAPNSPQVYTSHKKPGAPLIVQNCAKTTKHSTLASDAVHSSIVSSAKTSLVTLSNMTSSSFQPPTDPLVPKISLQPVLFQASQQPLTGLKSFISNVKSSPIPEATRLNLPTSSVSCVKNVAIHTTLNSVANLAQTSTASKSALKTNSVFSNLETEPITITNSPPQSSTLSQSLPFTTILNSLKQSHQAAQTNKTRVISCKKKIVQIITSTPSGAEPIAANVQVRPTIVKSNLLNYNVRPNVIPVSNRTYFFVSPSSTLPVTFTSPPLAQAQSSFSRLAFLPPEPVQRIAEKPIVSPYQVGAESIGRKQIQAVCTTVGPAYSTTTVISTPPSASTATIEAKGKKIPPKVIFLLPNNTNDASLGAFGQGASRSSLLRYKVTPAASSKSILNSVSNLNNSVEVLPCVTVNPDASLPMDPLKKNKRKRQRKSPQNLNEVAPPSKAKPKGVFVTSLRTGQGLVPVRFLFPDMGDSIDDDVSITHQTKGTTGYKQVKTVQSSVPNQKMLDKISAPYVPSISVDAGSDTDSDIEQSYMTEEQDIRLLKKLLTDSEQSQKTVDEVCVKPFEHQKSVSYGPHDFTITGSRIGGLLGVPNSKETKKSVDKGTANVLKSKPSTASSCIMPDEQNVQKAFDSKLRYILASHQMPNLEQLTKDSDQSLYEHICQEKPNVEILNNDVECAMEESCDLKIESVYSLKNQTDHFGLDHFIDLSGDVEADSINARTDSFNVPSDSFNVSLSNDWKQIIIPCFVVLERLSKSEVQSQGSREIQSRCSTHCRKRTLDYLCKLNLLACDNQPEMESFSHPEVHSVSPPKKVSKMCEPEMSETAMSPNMTINPDLCVASNSGPCVPINPDLCVPMNLDPSLTEKICPIPVTAHESRPLTPALLSSVEKVVSRSPQGVAHTDKLPNVNNKSTVSDHDLLNHNAGFQKLLQHLRNQVEKRRKQLHNYKKCQKRKIKIMKALEQSHGSESYLAKAEKTPEYDHEVVNECLKIITKTSHAESLSNFNSSAEKKIRKRRANKKISTGVKGSYSDMTNVSNKLTPPSAQSNMNTPTARTSHGSVGQASDGSIIPPNLPPLLHSVTINPSGQIIERTPHISQSKVENALKSLVKYLVTTGRKPTMDDNHYFLLKIDNQHVLVKIPSGSLPPLQGCEPGGSNIQKVNKTISSSAPKAISPGPLQTNNTATLQTNSTIAFKHVITMTSDHLKTSIDNKTQDVVPPISSSSVPQTILSNPGFTHILPQSQCSIPKANPTNNTSAAQHSLTKKTQKKTQVAVPSLLSFSAPQVSNSECTSTRILPQSQRSVTLMRINSKNRQSINTDTSATMPQPQQIPSIVNCDYGDSRSILSHLQPDSSLLPSRRKMTLQLTQAERAFKRQKLQQKYPLPPGVVIKSEPDGAEYALDDNWTVTSEISMTTPLLLPFLSDVISEPMQIGNRSAEKNIEQDVSEGCPPTSSSVSHRENSLERSDDPPCLTEETFSLPHPTPHTKETDSDPAEELPPVLHPMFTSAPTSDIEDQIALNSDKDAGIDSSNAETRMEDKIIHSSDVLHSLEAVASVSSSSLLSDKSYESHDSGYSTEPPSSITASLACVKPVYRNSKIERLKELLKKKEMEIETMRKRQSEIPMLDLDTV